MARLECPLQGASLGEVYKDLVLPIQHGPPLGRTNLVQGNTEHYTWSCRGTEIRILDEIIKRPAAEAVRGFAVVQENYQPVLEALKERLGHPRLILDAHIRSLIYLPRLNSDDALSMRKFYDQVVGHVRSVESMGGTFNTEILAPVLVPLIVDKLPKRVVERWELEFGKWKAKEDCVKVKKLFAFLEQEKRAKESSQSPSLEFKPSAKENTARCESR
ncbi:uncharacterized protein [Montipora foliosa]|uniref:uncharacterized protein n=1 Tax=Montipora foliosa TaxID=591990 RepID=UPI0035F1FFFF